MEIYERQKELYDETMCEDQGLPRCYYDERKGNPILKYGGRDEESCFELEHEQWLQNGFCVKSIMVVGVELT